jgi:hypothetical protein
LIPDNVTLDDGKTYRVTAIDESAFANDKTIEEVTIGSNIEIINENAFSGCSNLTTVKIKGNKLKTIRKGAFANCRKLKRQ